MKNIHHLFRILSILTLCALLTASAWAEDSLELRVWPAEETGDTYTAYSGVRAAAETGEGETETYVSHTSSDAVLEIIIRYEGFIAYPQGDGSGTYIGYGSSYQDAVAVLGANCAPITEDEAAEIVRYELSRIDTALDSFLESNGIIVNQNQYDALADFTYNCGIGWTIYKNSDGSWCKLKEMLLDDPSTWTEERTQEAFGTWVYDGSGNILQGLVRRRAEEATLFSTACTTGVYTDVAETDWYYSAVIEANEKGLMKGMGDGTFSPETNLTRAQLVTALANYDGVDLSGYTGSPFSDVAADSWFTAAVCWAAQEGYVEGVGDGLFLPDSPVTREQVCCILSRYLAANGVTAGESSLSFTDQDGISEYAREHVAFCTSLGLILGMEDGSFSPQGLTTRAQAATILVRMSQLG